MGGGCLLIALSNFLVSSPNFLFPAQTTSAINFSTFNETSGKEFLESQARREATLLPENILNRSARYEQIEEQANAPYALCSSLGNMI